MPLVKATHRYARISATKVRPFADLIRGKSAAEGVDVLQYLPNRGARMLEKVLKSAMANCEEQGARNVEGLRIVDARADGGPMFKRIRPRARGMAFLVRRRTSHIHVALDVPDLG
jgi:large subunit ribosomal protein L22